MKANDIYVYCGQFTYETGEKMQVLFNKIE